MTALVSALWARIKALFATPARTAATTGSGAVLIAAAAFVGPWEGERTEAYLDRIASPPVWTVCYGETRGVQPGDQYTPAQCHQMLIAALKVYHAGLAACIPALTSQPEGVQVALTSWAYNIGIGAACGSTLARRANAGDWRAACDELPRWNRAGGVVVRGLVNRRAAEQHLCLNSHN